MNDIRVISPPMPGADALRLSAIIAVFKRNLRALMRVWRVAITWFVIEPAIVLLALALGIGRLVGNVEGGISYAEFVAPGIVIGTAMYHSLGEAAWAAFERINQGVYETMLTAPVTVREIVLAELCFAAFRAILSTIAVGGFAIAFGWIPLSAWPALFVVSVGVGLVFGGVGQLFAALSPSIHVLTMVFTVVATPMFFFRAVSFRFRSCRIGSSPWPG
ncbi:MAG: ABC transporter permease [Gammaproteobacteria bacterium]|nr:ABC transporter permease [Gammaproteobacteria bacterium]